MFHETAKRLPKARFQAGDQLYLERWVGTTVGKRGRKIDRTEETPVEVIYLRHEATWNRGLDGRSIVEHPIYQVRVLATGEEFPASQSGLSKYPKVK